jgi:transposase
MSCHRSPAGGLELPRFGGHLILGETLVEGDPMGRPAKRPEEFRREAVNLVKGSGRPVAEVARSVEIAEGTLWNWAKADRERDARDADPDALSESERAESKRLRKESAQLRIDNGILRKAAAYFAPETNR